MLSTSVHPFNHPNSIEKRSVRMEKLTKRHLARRGRSSDGKVKPTIKIGLKSNKESLFILKPGRQAPNILSKEKKLLQFNLSAIKLMLHDSLV